MIDANLRLKASKCSFEKSQAKFLGHMVTRDGIQPNLEKVEKVKKYPVPKNVKEVRTFLGMVMYY